MSALGFALSELGAPERGGAAASSNDAAVLAPNRFVTVRRKQGNRLTVTAGLRNESGLQDRRSASSKLVLVASYDFCAKLA